MARLLPSISIAALALVAVACGDATAPRQFVTVELSVTRVEPPFIRELDENFPSIGCEVAFRAIASGEGSAEWLGARILWYAGVDRSTPIDSLVFDASEVENGWDEAGIGAGQTQNAIWTFWYVAPFTASMEFDYVPVGGEKRTAVAEFSCGPETPAGTPEPSVTKLEVTVAPDKLEPKDVLTVDYAATSPTGIWQTAVVLSGPCQVQQLFAERLEKRVTRSVYIPIPAECRLGVPLVVAVFARDAGLQAGARVLETKLTLVDESPPTLTAFFYPPYWGGEPDLRGIFYGGDTIKVYASVADNHEASELNWEAIPESLGLGGSIALNSADASSTILVQLPPESSGPIQLHLTARDAVGLQSNTITTTAGAARVYPTVERPTASATADGETWDLIADTRRGLAYLLQPYSARIAILSLTTMTVTGSIPLPSWAESFDISAGGDSLVIALPGERALGIVDLRQPSWRVTLIPLTILDAATDQRPDRVRTLSNGKAFVSLTASVPSAYVLIEVDLATGAQRTRADADEAGFVGRSVLARSLDHSVIIVTGSSYLRRYDVPSDHFGARRGPMGGMIPVVDGTGRHVSVGLGIYDESLQHVRDVSSPVRSGDEFPNVLSADGAYLYQILSDIGLVRARVSDGALLDRTVNPIAAQQIRISDDGTLIVTFTPSFSNPSRISTIDLR